MGCDEYQSCKIHECMKHEMTSPNGTKFISTHDNEGFFEHQVLDVSSMESAIKASERQLTL